MAEQRLELLQKKDKPQYASGSPLLLLASALYLDRSTNNCIAQLKWENIDQRTVKAVMIEIHGRDAFDQGADSIQYQYDGLTVNQGSEFGGKTPIMIKNNKIVKFTVSLKAVSFADETVWRPKSDVDFSTLPNAQKQTLSGELLDQFKRDLAKEGNRSAYAYTPQIADELWQCGCGSWQRGDAACIKCKSNYKSLIAASDLAVLQSHLRDYKEEQEKLRIEAEKRAEEERIAHAKAEEERRIAEEIRREKEAELQRQKEVLLKAKKKRNIKIFSTISAVAIIIIGGYFVYDRIIQPQNEYNQAQALLDSGNLDAAYDAFSEMLDYKDSEAKLLEINYKKAENFLAQGDLAEAKQYYNLAGEYSDAGQQIKNIDAYIAAESDYQKNDLASAGKKYRELGSFLDAASKFEAISGTLYSQAKEALDDKDYEQAFSLLTTLDDYSDCRTLIANIDSEYEAALTLWNNGEKLQAEQGLQSLVGWRDVDEKLVDLRLEIADDSAKSENYDTALAYYGKVPSTEEIEKKIASASQGKAYQEALTALDSGKLETAHEKFVAAGEHKDAAQQAALIESYEQANILIAEGKYEEARNIYIGLGNYLSSASKLAACNAALYQEASELYNGGNLTEAYDLYTLISGYSDSKEIADKMDSEYQAALDHIEKGERLEAEAVLVKLAGWKDVNEKLESIRQDIADKAVETGDFDTAISYYNLLSNKTEDIEAKLTVAIQGKNYNEAVAALKAGDLETAYTKYAAAGDYKDAAEQASMLAAYKLANTQLDEGKYQEARKAYIDLGSFLDSATKLNTCNDALYQEATGLKDQGDYAKAYELFVLISGHSDSADIAKKIRDDYKAANDLLKNGKYDEANAAFLALHNYSDSPIKAQESLYQKAEALITVGSFDDAITIYSSLEEYKDSKEKINKCLYKKAEAQLESMDLDASIKTFESIIEYSDSKTRILEPKYLKANALMNQGEYDKAITIFQELGSYSDSKTLIKKATADKLYDNGDYSGAYDIYSTLDAKYQNHNTDYSSMYQQAEELLTSGNYDDAYDVYISLGNYSDSKSKAKQCGYDKASSLLSTEKYEDAATVYESIGDIEKAQETKYTYAGKLATSKDYQSAATIYLSLGEYKDSREQHYQMGSNAFDDGLLAVAYEIYAEDEEYSDSKEQIYQIGTSASTIKDFELSVQVFSFIGAYKDSKMKLTKDTYELGKKYLENGENEKAVEILSSMGDFSDAAALTQLAKYRVALGLMDSKEYDKAAELFESLNGYEDSVNLAQKSRYESAKALLQNKDYSNAKSAFSALGDYSNASEMAKECDYLPAKALYDSKKWEEALNIFCLDSLDGYKEVDTLINECQYQLGIAAMDKKDYDAALVWFNKNQDYKTSQNLVLECKYQIALIIKAEGKMDDAINAFTEIEDYKDSRALISSCYYTEAAAAEIDGQLETAYSAYTNAGDYLDSKVKAEKAAIAIGLQKEYETDYNGAISWFEKAKENNEAQQQILSIGEYYYSTSQFEQAETVYLKLIESEEALSKLYEIASYYESNNRDEDALRVFESIKNYSDSNNHIIGIKRRQITAFVAEKEYGKAFNILKSIESNTQSEEYIVLSILSKGLGSSVSFGSYTIEKNKGAEPITWTIIAESKNGKLLLCNYNLDNKKFNEKWANVSWEESTLRAWLNSEFFENAFSEDEQKYINEVSIPNRGPNAKSLKATRDRIFVLSEEEWKESPLYGKGTPNSSYAISKGVYNSKNGIGWSWLRTAGVDQDHAMEIDCNGFINTVGSFVDCKNTGVRPAFWLEYQE